MSQPTQTTGNPREGQRRAATTGQIQNRRSETKKCKRDCSDSSETGGGPRATTTIQARTRHAKATTADSGPHASESKPKGGQHSPKKQGEQRSQNTACHNKTKHRKRSRSNKLTTHQSRLNRCQSRSKDMLRIPTEEERGKEVGKNNQRDKLDRRANVQT